VRVYVAHGSSPYTSCWLCDKAWVLVRCGADARPVIKLCVYSIVCSLHGVHCSEWCCMPLSAIAGACMRLPVKIYALMHIQALALRFVTVPLTVQPPNFLYRTVLTVLFCTVTLLYCPVSSVQVAGCVWWPHCRCHCCCTAASEPVLLGHHDCCDTHAQQHDRARAAGAAVVLPYQPCWACAEQV
jgi:hypothetical protein